MLVAVQTHPVQYHAPVYRALNERFGVPVTAVYASDFSVVSYRDREFGATFAWDADLLSGYRSVFLSRVEAGGARSFEAVSSRGLASALASLRPSVVMVAGYRPHLHRAALFHAWRQGCRVLFRGETTDTEPESAIAGTARRMALKAFYSRFDRLLYIGQRSKRHFTNLGYDGARLEFSPYCADISSFQTDEAARARLRDPLRRSLGIAADDHVVLFSGKLSPRKRPDLLVEALVALQRAGGRFAALFVGDGELKAALQTAAAVAPGVPAHFVGFKNQSELSPYYHAADCLALPSQHSETWGVVVNEALGHGLPCVASDQVGCAPDLVVPGRTGDVFETGSMTSLKDAIFRTAALSGRLEIREACRSLANEYSVDRAAAGIAHAYRSVCPQ